MYKKYDVIRNFNKSNYKESYLMVGDQELFLANNYLFCFIYRRYVPYANIYYFILNHIRTLTILFLSLFFLLKISISSLLNSLPYLFILTLNFFLMFLKLKIYFWFHYFFQLLHILFRIHWLFSYCFYFKK